MYLEPEGTFFVCMGCSGIAYESSVRNHNPVYVGLWKPLHTLRRLSLELIRSRSHTKKSRLRERVAAARGEIESFFMGPWRRISSQVITHRAGIRNLGYFDELVESLLGEDVIDYVYRTFGKAGSSAKESTIDPEALRSEIQVGIEEISTWHQWTEVSQAPREGQWIPLVLSALVTYEINRYLGADEDAVLEAIADGGVAEHILEDPDAMLDYLGRLMAAEAAEAKQEAS